MIGHIIFLNKIYNTVSIIKKNVYLAQVNTTYGKACFMPYSVGLLQANAQANPVIQANYEFKDLLFLRNPINEVLSKLDNPAVFGLSCYIWNFEYNMALGTAVKEKYPNCLMVLGGPSVPIRESTKFLNDYLFADILVHYEGEAKFTEILLENLNENPKFNKIEGAVTRYKDLITIGGINTKKDRMVELDLLPSPYLTGVFDKIIKEPYEFNASQETHRGCPYSCTFCDWGSATMSKVNQFGTERILKEIEWFAQNKIELFYNCDANYGLFKRDIELTQQMCDIKTKYGYPKLFRASYAKNSNDTIFTIATILNKAGMNRGITLSFQSMDDNTLQVIKRKNIKVENFKELMKRYKAESIITYSEIIVGLPGETYDSFANGLNTLVDCGQHDSILIFICQVLPNAEMNAPEYRELHGIKTVRGPVLLSHSTPLSDPHQEYYDLVIETKSMPYPDWLKTNMFAWVVQCFHCLFITQCITIFLNNEYNISYRQFYESLLEWADNNPSSVIGKAAQQALRLYIKASKGEPWYIIDSRFGEITWTPEEGSYLQLIAEKEKLYSDIYSFISTKFNIDKTILTDLITYQSNIIISPDQIADIKIDLSYDFDSYFNSTDASKINNKPVSYLIKISKTYENLFRYAREVIWYGRKGGSIKHQIQGG